MFFSLIEAYTPWHLRLLAFFNAPDALANKPGAFQDLHGNQHYLQYDQVLEGVFPELQGRRRFYDQMLSVLERDALVFDIPAAATVSRRADGTWHIHGLDKVLTQEGRDFVRFVRSPESTLK